MPPIEDFIRGISIGDIYWFVNPQINSLDPHPHVCLGILEDNDCVFMLCGTSQFETKRRHFELTGLPYETLVRIQPNHTNTIVRDTFVDCNDVQTHDVGDLYYNETLQQRGMVNDAELLQIRDGIEISDLLEQVTKNEILRMFPDL
jgi:hypothetical protein